MENKDNHFNITPYVFILILCVIGYFVYDLYTSRPIVVDSIDKKTVVEKLNETQHKLDSVISLNQDINIRVLDDNNRILTEIEGINLKLKNLNELGNYEKSKLFESDDIDNAIFYLEYIKRYRAERER